MEFETEILEASFLEVAEALASQDWEADRELERVTLKTDALRNDVRDSLQGFKA